MNQFLSKKKKAGNAKDIKERLRIFAIKQKDKQNAINNNSIQESNKQNQESSS